MDTCCGEVCKHEDPAEATLYCFIYMAACFSVHVDPLCYQHGGLRDCWCIHDLSGTLEIHRAQVTCLYLCTCVYFSYNSIPGVSIFESKNTLNIESEICVIAKPVLRTESLLTSTLLSVCCKERFIMCSRGLTLVVFEDNHLCHFFARVCVLLCVLRRKNI